MTKDEVLEAVFHESGNLATESTLIADLDLDSLEFMNLLVALGIPDAPIEELNTVADLIAKAA